MGDNDRTDSANELNAEDLDMAVGGRAIKADVKVRATEEHVKMTGKAEEKEKFVAAPGEKKMERE